MIQSIALNSNHYDKIKKKRPSHLTRAFSLKIEVEKDLFPANNDAFALAAFAILNETKEMATYAVGIEVKSPQVRGLGTDSPVSALNQ